ncbi:MAG: hypothetical protein WA989_03655 [Henriciella sp.]|uniref:hypothetical protein n=1 Tax=Henriciella sp. TaxID=1968823 RepID=UPI003C70E592
MDLLRNILTAIWCAVIIGTNMFGLMIIARVAGLDGLLADGTWIMTSKLALMTGFGLAALVSTKFLWAILAVAVFWTLLNLIFDFFVQGSWGSPSTMSGLFVIVPTYLLARWNSAVRKTNFNPVKEF